jgi:hypothetical protein
MRAKAGLIPVFAASLMALAGGGWGVDAARAEENCLAAPSGKAPEGSHWHYRTDAATQTKCWYLRAAGETGQKPATQDKSETAVTAKSPAAATPKAAPDQAAASLQQPRPPQAARAAAGGGPTPRSTPAPWPDPPAQAGAGAGGVAWPDPTRLPGGSMAAQQPGGATQQAPGSPASDQQEPAAPAANSDQGQANNAASDGQVATPVAATISDNDQMTLGLLLALAISLLIAGIFVRRIARKMFARRLKIAPQRREPVLNANVAGAGTILHHDDLEPGWVERLDGDVQAALRNLLRTLERQAA